MDDEVAKIHKFLRRSRIATFLIIAFLALLTYLLIVVSRQVSSEQAFIFQPKANEMASMGGRSISSISQQDGDVMTRTENSETIVQSSYENIPASVCGDCVSSITRGVWKDDPTYDPRGCQSRITCKNGPPDRSKLGDLRAIISCHTLAELLALGVKEEEIIGGPMGDNDLICEWKSQGTHDACIANEIETPNWEYIAAKMCGCGFSRDEQGKLICDNGDSPYKSIKAAPNDPIVPPSSFPTSGQITSYPR